MLHFFSTSRVYSGLKGITLFKWKYNFWKPSFKAIWIFYKNGANASLHELGNIEFARNYMALMPDIFDT